MTIWHLTSEAKRQRTRHLAGHRRLGDTFSKCGKRLGEHIDSEALLKYYDPCLLCREQEVKEQERLKVIHKKDGESCAVLHRDVAGNTIPCPAFTLVPQQAPRVVLWITPAGGHTLTKPKGVRVEVVDMKPLESHGVCDRAGADCTIPMPHQHFYYYEEREVPAK